MLQRLANIANELDAAGMFEEADQITYLIKQYASRVASKDDKDSLSDKILALLEKEGIKCPECDGDMEFDSDADNYGMCNCGDENCDCTIDLQDEVENFINKIDSGDVECPECKGKMKLKDMHCVCVNGKCKCKKHAKEMMLGDLFSGVEFDKLNKKTASKREDHEYHMARKQLMAAKEAIEDILDAMGDEEEGDIMAWAQSYLTMASDYLQSVKNYMKYGPGNLDSDEDEEVEETENKFATAAKKPTNKKLNKPFRTPGGPKKFAVYVKNDKGNIVKVTFGDPNLSIKRDDPNRRKNFRARHNCDTDPRAKDRTTAKYWSCKFWSTPSVSSLLKG